MIFSIMLIVICVLSVIVFLIYQFAVYYVKIKWVSGLYLKQLKTNLRAFFSK